MYLDPTFGLFIRHKVIKTKRNERSNSHKIMKARKQISEQ